MDLTSHTLPLLILLKNKLLSCLPYPPLANSPPGVIPLRGARKLNFLLSISVCPLFHVRLPDLPPPCRLTLARHNSRSEVQRFILATVKSLQYLLSLWVPIGLGGGAAPFSPCLCSAHLPPSLLIGCLGHIPFYRAQWAPSLKHRDPRILLLKQPCSLYIRPHPCKTRLLSDTSSHSSVHFPEETLVPQLYYT